MNRANKTVPRAPAQSQDWDAGRVQTTVIMPGLLIAIVDSDDEEGVRSAVWQESKMIGVVVQRRSTGQTTIHFGPNVDDWAMKDALRVLRIREMEKETGRISTWNDWGQFSQAAIFYGWDCAELKKIVSSGQDTTRLTVDDIVSAIRLAVNLTMFDTERSKWCEQGVCRSQERNQCPLFRFGLSRCNNVRKTTKDFSKE